MDRVRASPLELQAGTLRVPGSMVLQVDKGSTRLRARTYDEI